LCVLRHYSQILQILSVTLSREDHNLVLDNICAAIARLIVVNINGIPMDQVFPVFMGKLPMREDFEENTWILKVFLYLLQNGHPLCASHLPQILNVVSVITTQQEPLPGMTASI